MFSRAVEFLGMKEGFYRGDLTILKSNFIKTERVFGAVVDKLWESVWGNLWETCGKVYTYDRFARLLHSILGKSYSYSQDWWKVLRGHLHSFLPLLFGWFCTFSTGPTTTTTK